MPINEHSFISTTSQDTKKIAKFLLEKYFKEASTKPLVFILEGEMGVGKTVFAQGLGRHLEIDDIISPTYVIYYEYPVKNNLITMFLHADLYAIEENEEFSYLGIENYLKKGTALCLEWGNKVGPLFKKIKEKSKVLVVNMEYKDENNRIITVKEL